MPVSGLIDIFEIFKLQVKFLPQYVNRLKSQNFTLKEKMTRWVKQSPYALIKKHLPPDDHYVDFPTVSFLANRIVTFPALCIQLHTSLRARHQLGF